MNDPDAKPCGHFRDFACDCLEARAARVEEQDAEIARLRSRVQELEGALRDVLGPPEWDWAEHTSPNTGETWVCCDGCQAEPPATHLPDCRRAAARRALASPSETRRVCPYLSDGRKKPCPRECPHLSASWRCTLNDAPAPSAPREPEGTP